jgi:septal ring factor EnvC (AmiA/AmiB activator)
VVKLIGLLVGVFLTLLAIGCSALQPQQEPDKRIAQMQQQIASLEQEVATLRQQVAQMESQVMALQNTSNQHPAIRELESEWLKERILGPGLSK